MTEKERDILVQMLASTDKDMQKLGISTFPSLINSLEQYVFLRCHKDYKEIEPIVAKDIRKVFVNSHGKIRRKYKKW